MKDIKQLAQEEADRLYPTVTQYQSVEYNKMRKNCFIKGAEFGYNQRWIPVTPETMPKEENIVLASNGTYTFLCEYKMGQFYRHTDMIGQDRIMSFYYKDIIAWMPIPKYNPPKS